MSQTFLPLLGVQPKLGRPFTAEECLANGPKVAMLSHAFWERRFAGDTSIIGKSLRLNDQLVTVVAVLPATFDFGAIFSPGTHADVFTPFPLDQGTDRMGNTMAIIGRLKPGATLPCAQSEAEMLGNQISSENKKHRCSMCRATL